MSAYREIELKLRTDADALTKVRRSGWWRELGPAQRQSLHSIYFDTGDRQLRDCNISLHTHTNGRAITQTVTMRNGHADPASGREWEMLVPDPVPDPTLVIERIRAGLKFLSPDKLLPAPDCGMKYLPRAIAFGKLKALADGATIVRRALA